MLRVAFSSNLGSVEDVMLSSNAETLSYKTQLLGRKCVFKMAISHRLRQETVFKKPKMKE